MEDAMVLVRMGIVVLLVKRLAMLSRVVVGSHIIGRFQNRRVDLVRVLAVCGIRLGGFDQRLNLTRLNPGMRKEVDDLLGTIGRVSIRDESKDHGRVLDGETHTGNFFTNRLNGFLSGVEVAVHVREAQVNERRRGTKREQAVAQGVQEVRGASKAGISTEEDGSCTLVVGNLLVIDEADALEEEIGQRSEKKLALAIFRLNGTIALFFLLTYLV